MWDYRQLPRLLIRGAPGSASPRGMSNSYDCCNDIDEVFAIVWSHEGQESLKYLLNTYLENGTADRDVLFDVADRLQDAGLVDAANVVREAAGQMDDPAIALIADVLDDPVRGNVKSRLKPLSQEQSHPRQSDFGRR